MMTGLRQADVLFAPMTFAPRSRDNMSVSFPSKLADYTAAGVPILIHAPAHSSAVCWAHMYHPVAVVVNVDDPTMLADAIVGLRTDRVLRQQLADRARQVGDACFDFTAGRAVFESAW
jgi:hypothetical protein